MLHRCVRHHPLPQVTDEFTNALANISISVTQNEAKEAKVITYRASWRNFWCVTPHQAHP